MLTPSDLQAIDTLLENKLEQKLEQKLKPIKKDMRKIKKDLKTTIDFFDHEHTDLVKRADRLENHLHLPPTIPQ